MSIFDDFQADSEDPIDLFGTHSNREATRITRELSERGLTLQRDLFSQLRGDSEPVRQGRNEALNLLRGIADGSFSPDRNPGFEYRIDQGQRSIDAQQAARGKLNSGERDIRQQDFVATETANDYNNTVNRLLNTAGYTTSDLNQNNALLQNNVNQQSNQLLNVGYTNANNIINQQNSRNRALNSAAFAGGYFGGQ